MVDDNGFVTAANAVVASLRQENEALRASNKAGEAYSHKWEQRALKAEQENEGAEEGEVSGKVCPYCHKRKSAVCPHWWHACHNALDAGGEKCGTCGGIKIVEQPGSGHAVPCPACACPNSPHDGPVATGTGREEFEALVDTLIDEQSEVCNDSLTRRQYDEARERRNAAKAAVLAAFSAARGVDYEEARKELAAQLNELQEGDLALIDVFDVRRIVDRALSGAGR